MEQLTKEQVCDEINRLREEFAKYVEILDRFNDEDKAQFSKRVQSMVGGYFVRKFGDTDTYYRIDDIKDIDGTWFRATCKCAYVVSPKYTDINSRMELGIVYIDSHSIDEFLTITKENFQAVVNEFNQRFA